MLVTKKVLMQGDQDDSQETRISGRQESNTNIYASEIDHYSTRSFEKQI